MIKMDSIRATLLLTFCAVALPALGAEQRFTPQPNGQITFTMPSGNVGCIYTPKGGTATYEPAGGGPEINCDRIEPSYINVVLGPEGPAVLTENPGEQGCCSGDNVFAYGNTAHLGGFICSSSMGGLTCETPDKRHGFCVAKARMLHY
jgi:hypothetical protein